MDLFNYYLKQVSEIGFVQQIIGSIVYIDGLPGAKLDELVVFENNQIGEVTSLHEDVVEVMMFSNSELAIGARTTRTNNSLTIPVGKELLGKTISPLGQSLDSKPFKKPTEMRGVHANPYGIEYRQKISHPLDTGVTVVDLLVPLGRGQRELVIGDRKTGKTSFLMQTISEQAKNGTICIYTAIGKQLSNIKQLELFLETNKIRDKTVIVAASPQDANGLLFLAPYSAMTIAEYFRDQGQDVLIILDDLITHAKFCREIALLAKRFPGRNSYPVDMFFVHSKLLERSGNFLINGRVASITALPVAETTQGDLSGYIQTNLMSITDGHIFFDSDLFSKGRRPAVNPFLSVTRVGNQTQTKLKREISREMLSFLTISEKMFSFTHFGAELNIATKQILMMRDAILNFLDQTHNETISTNLQIIIFALIWSNIWSSLSYADLKKKSTALSNLYHTNEEYKKSVDELIASFDALNPFLGAIRKNVNVILPNGV